MRRTFFAALMLAGSIALPVSAQFHVSIGINLPAYPVLERVPGYPVYYAPRVNSNYFFYDGLYWVYQGDNWHSSPWYNGPWDVVDRYQVPVYLLRVPVRYYRSAPVHFRGWRADAPPRWGDHWGQSWEQRYTGWDRWDRSRAPAPAPLPVYQQRYSGNNYPSRSEQVVIRERSYRHEPRDDAVRQRYEQHRSSVASAERGHPPGQAKGWEGRDRPPGQAKGWDKENQGNQGRGNDGRGNEGRREEPRGPSRNEVEKAREEDRKGQADTNRGN